MKAFVLGKKKVQFEDEKGLHQFYKLSVQHKFPPDSEFAICEGIACSEISVPPNVFTELKINTQVLLDFDRNGKLLDYELLED